MFASLTLMLAVSSPPPRTVFGPGVISAATDATGPAFAPDGKTVYFTLGNGSFCQLFESQLSDGTWSHPTVAPFSGAWRDLEASMSPDGSFLVFSSNRPTKAGAAPVDAHYGNTLHAAMGGNLWIVHRETNGWGTPQWLPPAINDDDSIFSPSVAANGDIYFMKPVPPKGSFEIFRSHYVHGAYQPAELMPFSDPQYGNVDPAVAPDQSFIVFSSNRSSTNSGRGLFISFRHGDTWTVPVNLDPLYGLPGGEIEAKLGPDGHTLYYSNAEVVPPSSPATQSDIDDMLSWNNGLVHIWKIDLAPVLKQ